MLAWFSSELEDYSRVYFFGFIGTVAVKPPTERNKELLACLVGLDDHNEASERWEPAKGARQHYTIRLMSEM